jgi:hypothetical protein
MLRIVIQQTGKDNWTWEIVSPRQEPARSTDSYNRRHDALRGARRFLIAVVGWVPRTAGIAHVWDVQVEYYDRQGRLFT